MNDIIQEESYTSKSPISEEGEEAHRLSFCDLPMEEYSSGSIHTGPKTPSAAETDQLFEFFTSQPRPDHSDTNNGVIFCGKIINEEEEDELNEYQKRDYFATNRSQSFRKLHRDTTDNRVFSSSTRFSGDLTRPKCSAMDLSYHVQRVNISSLTNMSAKSRRRMFMFGMVKFKPDMELSAIKQRQERRLKAEKTASIGGGVGTSKWGLVKSSLRGRSHLTSALASSLACIPAAWGGEVSVAN